MTKHTTGKPIGSSPLRILIRDHHEGTINGPSSISATSSSMIPAVKPTLNVDSVVGDGRSLGRGGSSPRPKRVFEDMPQQT